ncbi:hypothetical protein K502DRAFT_353793, partial [Neoconidiobolus thromboides FSU 785]
MKSTTVISIIVSSLIPSVISIPTPIPNDDYAVTTPSYQTTDYSNAYNTGKINDYSNSNNNAYGD